MKIESEKTERRIHTKPKIHNKRRVAKTVRLSRIRQKQRLYHIYFAAALVIFTVCLISITFIFCVRYIDKKHSVDAQNEMIEQINEIRNTVYSEEPFDLPSAGVGEILQTELLREQTISTEVTILPEYEQLYEQNTDMVGWLKIADTVIDYPVMQTMDDENYYLEYGFDKTPDSNGCLIMDTDSIVGTGTKEGDYLNGTAPSTNLIIHGHAMKSGLMFGGLKKYDDKHYGLEHSVIRFDSLYEQREYQVISVFYSQVFYKTDEIFKYYKFFQADTQEEFDDWYNNIKNMSIYDTGVTAEFGDEFITLSCCSYQVEDGRFVVVGKRMK